MICFCIVRSDIQWRINSIKSEIGLVLRTRVPKEVNTIIADVIIYSAIIYLTYPNTFDLEIILRIHSIQSRLDLGLKL